MEACGKAVAVFYLRSSVTGSESQSYSKIKFFGINFSCRVPVTPDRSLKSLLKNGKKSAVKSLKIPDTTLLLYPLSIYIIKVSFQRLYRSTAFHRKYLQYAAAHHRAGSSSEQRRLGSKSVALDLPPQLLFIM